MEFRNNLNMHWINHRMNTQTTQIHHFRMRMRWGIPYGYPKVRVISLLDAIGSMGMTLRNIDSSVSFICGWKRSVEVSTPHERIHTRSNAYLGNNNKHDWITWQRKKKGEENTISGCIIVGNSIPFSIKPHKSIQNRFDPCESFKTPLSRVHPKTTCMSMTLERSNTHVLTQQTHLSNAKASNRLEWCKVSCGSYHRHTNKVIYTEDVSIYIFNWRTDIIALCRLVRVAILRSYNISQTRYMYIIANVGAIFTLPSII